MGGDHAVFGDVEKVIEEMLVPSRSVSWWKAAYAAREQVHMKEGYLGPGIEGWSETKG